MPPFIFLALLGIGAVAGFKMLSKLAADEAKPQEARRAESRGDARSAAAQPGAARDLGELEYDAESGVYRPAPSRRQS